MNLLRHMWICIRLFFKMMHVTFQMMYGTWKIAKLSKPIISIFGGSRLPEQAIYFLQAHELAERCVVHGISVLTGGGPGIMKAATEGAMHPGNTKGKSIGIGVRGLSEERNPYVQEYFELDYFFARKWLLTHYSNAFVIFPGGFGTLDELSEVLTLIQTKQMPRVPIVLIGTSYWAYFMKWVREEALSHGLLTAEEVKLFIVTDNLEYAFCVIRNECPS
jgi:uncharacterized protein (TIGR00730 family)